MKYGKTIASRLLILGVALLILAGCCGRSVALGERFTLWKGEMVRVREAGLVIEIETVIYQQPGSQTPGDGFVDLRVTERDGRETTVTLSAGQKAQVGGYEIHLERLVVGVESDGCELVVLGDKGTSAATWLILIGLATPSLLLVGLDAYIQKRGK